jgi:hypothetical protein
MPKLKLIACELDVKTLGRNELHKIMPIPVVLSRTLSDGPMLPTLSQPFIQLKHGIGIAN